jgi:ribonucleoside-diphosphate reductase beta chain
MTQQCSKSFNLCQLYSEQPHTGHLCFFDPDGGPAIQRTDVVKYQNILKLNQKMLGFFWRPEEINLNRDVIDFSRLSDKEQKIFTETLLRATMLDSVQGRSPSMTLLPIVSLPEVEAAITTWDFFEGSIHSASYMYIIKAIYTNPDNVFNQLKDITEIVDCAKSISFYYDELHKLNVLRDAVSIGAVDQSVYNEYEHKKALWNVLISINGLESIRFYAAFATFFSFNESDMMIGSGRILSMIARDESLHTSLTSMLINILPKEDPDFAKIAAESIETMSSIYMDILNQELEWVRYIFADGGMLGLNEEILSEYVKYRAATAMTKFGVPSSVIATINAPKANPIPWINSYLDQGSDVQLAPQEVELTNYIVGGTKMDDISIDDLGFEL